MENIVNKKEKEELILALTGTLPLLRAAIGISQGELAEYIGVSRQTYCALEIGKRQMNTLPVFVFHFKHRNKHPLKQKKALLHKFINIAV